MGLSWSTFVGTCPFESFRDRGVAVLHFEKCEMFFFALLALQRVDFAGSSVNLQPWTWCCRVYLLFTSCLQARTIHHQRVSNSTPEMLCQLLCQAGPGSYRVAWTAPWMKIVMRGFVFLTRYRRNPVHDLQLVYLMYAWVTNCISSEFFVLEFYISTYHSLNSTCHFGNLTHDAWPIVDQNRVWGIVCRCLLFPRPTSLLISIYDIYILIFMYMIHIYIYIHFELFRCMAPWWEPLRPFVEWKNRSSPRGTPMVASWVVWRQRLPPRKLTWHSPWTWAGPQKEGLIFQPSIFRGEHVSFRAATPLKTNGWNPKIGGWGGSFSFSFWVYLQVPAVSFRGKSSSDQNPTYLQYIGDEILPSSIGILMSHEIRIPMKQSV